LNSKTFVLNLLHQKYLGQGRTKWDLWNE